MCCAFSGGCGSVATYNNTYFSSGAAPASPCQMRVCRAGTEVSAATCHVPPRVHVSAAGVPAQTQLRHVRDRAAEHQRARGHGPQQQGQLHTGHIIALDLAISSDVSVIINHHVHLFLCISIPPTSSFQARFTAQSDGPNPPVICGKNSGQSDLLL